MTPTLLMFLMVATGDAPPAATIDLTTRAGVSQVRGDWRFAEARPVEATFSAPGPDGRPAGQPITTWDIEPHAGAAGFDDSSWPVIDPSSLAMRRSTGKVCFAWYRIDLTMPGRVGGVDVTGSTAVFEIVVDDYAEVWVDGELPRELGQRGGSMVAGFNAPNRLVIDHDVRPGQRFQIAVFAINGPISAAPSNYIWVRSAKLEFHRPASPVVTIERIDPRLDEVMGSSPPVRVVAGGFTWVEGPVWDATRDCLYFTDIPANTAWRWQPDAGTSVLLRPSGYTGKVLFTGREPGANGLAVDAQGRVILCRHGDRNLARLEPDGTLAVLADRYNGKRLNSPNDVVVAADGSMYFTDPPFGLPGAFLDPARELDFCGVYRRSPDGELTLLIDDLEAPNGVTLSPDGRTLYVTNADPARPIVMAWDLASDGRAVNGRVLFDASPWVSSRPGLPDGLKTDSSGRLYLAGPGGIYVIGADGAHLGTVVLGVPVSNCAWGGGGAGGGSGSTRVRIDAVRHRRHRCVRHRAEHPGTRLLTPRGAR